MGPVARGVDGNPKRLQIAVAEVGTAASQKAKMLVIRLLTRLRWCAKMHFRH